MKPGNTHELADIIAAVRPPRDTLMAQAQARLDNLTKPRGSLGRLEEIAVRIACIAGRVDPQLANKVVFTMAADHGVADENVSLYPKAVTEQMVYNFLRGGAAVNVLARHAGARVVVVDMGVAADIADPGETLAIRKIAYGTASMTKGPAMTRDEAIRAIRAGFEVVAEEHARRPIDIVALGDMGIANTTASSAIVSCITALPPEETTGRGTGIDDERLAWKICEIETALDVNRPDPADPIDVLAKVGGFEIGGLAGAVICAAKSGVPVVIDGFITAAAALIAVELCPAAKGYLFASHNSVEKGHLAALNWMGIEPLFDLEMRLGEGTGACLGIGIIEAAVKLMNEMATFESAGVSRETPSES